jgi:intracellular sulfur oxidation DsrE/DsrF family protein
MMSDSNVSVERRGFLGGIVAGAAAAGLAAVASAPSVVEAADAAGTDFQKWLGGIRGKYRQLYDMPDANGGMGLIWSWVFQQTGAQGYGVTDKDLGVVVVLRHNAIPIAMTDRVWAKYNLGQVFKINDPATGIPATRNPFYNSRPGDLLVPDASLDKLLAKGVKFGACNMAITVYSGLVAKQQGLNHDDVKQDWLAAVIPGVDVVPSGVLAINGAQSKGCTYVYAG